ncbi:MAG: pyrroline-5-carboxylate reductase [Proteobacteria bacterium]|jgi:pyrroline-5-carboxylate reductase|nr:pyrroline-5-carboxylate reductase [Pseudomonadota bacterium]
MQIKVGFIGGGNMAAGLIGGLVPGNIASKDVIVSEPNVERRAVLAEQFGVEITTDNNLVCQISDVVVLAVKPQIMAEVAQQLELDESTPLFISIAAGISISKLQNWLGSAAAYPIVRVMPNTPALVGCGASGLFAGPGVNQQQKEIAQTLVDSVGISFWVDSETNLDLVTALSGSGPAYFLLFIKALVDRATQAGLSAKVAEALAMQTAIGAATLAKTSDDDLTTLIQNVTSPGGTTEKALEVLNNKDVSAIIAEAFDAAQQRSEEMAVEFGSSFDNDK